MKKETVIGVDIGGTKVQAACIKELKVDRSKKRLITATGTKEEVIQEVISTIAEVFNPSVSGIGLGVPSIVDVKKGIVYDVQNIPSWTEVHLKAILEERFQVPVYVNNDANCFVVGEKYFGKGQNYNNLIGLIVGTGIAGGIIIQNQLYNGHNGGAGEFGMLPYLDHHYEYYASGQFFTNEYNTTGEKLFTEALKGNPEAFSIFNEFGSHLGNAIIAILYTFDPEIIIMGGSVSKAYRFYKKALWDRLQDFAYKPTVDRLTIEISENSTIPVLGAAALYFDAQLKT